MSTYQEAKEALFAILVNDCKVNTNGIDDDAKLQDDLGLDSMTLLNLALEAENFLGCPLDEDPENPPLTVRALTELVATRIEEQRHVA